MMLEAVLCNTGIAHNAQAATLAAGGETLAGHLAGGESAKFTGNTVVVLHDQSQVPGFGAGTAEFDASIAAVDQLGSAATEVGARLVLFQTWGHQHGDQNSDLADVFPDYETMHDRLISGYAEYLSDVHQAAAPDATIAAVGQAWRWVNGHDPAVFASLYASDGTHPSLMGTYPERSQDHATDQPDRSSGRVRMGANGHSNARRSAPAAGRTRGLGALAL